MSPVTGGAIQQKREKTLIRQDSQHKHTGGRDELLGRVECEMPVGPPRGHDQKADGQICRSEPGEEVGPELTALRATEWSSRLDQVSGQEPRGRGEQTDTWAGRERSRWEEEPGEGSKRYWRDRGDPSERAVLHVPEGDAGGAIFRVAWGPCSGINL